MSSAFSLNLSKNSGRSMHRFHVIEFLVKSTPALCVAFIVYVTLKGVLW
jgi:hypothetical protein